MSISPTGYLVVCDSCDDIIRGRSIQYGQLQEDEWNTPEEAYEEAKLRGWGIRRGPYHPVAFICPDCAKETDD